MSSDMVKRLCIFQRNDSMTLEKDFHASYATNFGFLWNAEVVSGPVRAWKESNDVATYVPIFVNIWLVS